MTSVQEFIHWLEQGRGARWLLRVALGVAALAITGLYSWKQFHGLPTEFTLREAELGRQVAQGQGFTTRINHPQVLAVLQRRGESFREAEPFPELYHAPLYPLTLAAVFAVLPDSIWRNRPVQPGGWTLDGWLPDYVVLIVNLLLFWVAVGLAGRLAAKLFDARAGWLAALATAASVPLWQQTVAVNGLPLFMVLALAVFNLLADLETGPAEWSRAALARAGAVGLIAALLFLTEYSAGLALPVLAAAVGLRVDGAARWRALATLLAVFAVVAAPWLARNVAVSGHPLGLAWHNLALKAGDPTAEPVVFRNTLDHEPPGLDMKKLGNKGLTGLELNLKERLWSGGGLLLTAFFVAGLAYQFRHAPTNRVRWTFAVLLLVLLAGQPFFGSGESPRLPAFYLAPLVIVFGVGFFLVLVDSQPRLADRWRWVAGGLLALQALPLVRDALEPKKIHFHFPPYYPALFMELAADAERRFMPGTGLAADVPAGAAWYGRTRVWPKPHRFRDFQSIYVQQSIGALLLTPVTLDRPFFTELAARGEDAIRLTDTGGWGGVYTGLVTRTMPRNFPLNLPPQRLTENMVLLVNPTALRPRGN